MGFSRRDRRVSAVQRVNALGSKSSSPPGAMKRGLVKQSETRRYTGERIARGRAARMCRVQTNLKGEIV